MHTETILIVSSDTVQVELLYACLQEAGYIPQVAEQGQQALDAMHNSPAPDLALIDRCLPDMNGLTLVRRLRSVGRCTIMPLVFIGEGSSDEERLLAYEAGADLCLHEGIHSRVLIARLRALLRRAPAG